MKSFFDKNSIKHSLGPPLIFSYSQVSPSKGFTKNPQGPPYPPPWNFNYCAFMNKIQNWNCVCLWGWLTVIVLGPSVKYLFSTLSSPSPYPNALIQSVSQSFLIFSFLFSFFFFLFLPCFLFLSSLFPIFSLTFNCSWVWRIFFYP